MGTVPDDDLHQRIVDQIYLCMWHRIFPGGLAARECNTLAILSMRIGRLMSPDPRLKKLTMLDSDQVSMLFVGLRDEDLQRLSGALGASIKAADAIRPIEEDKMDLYRENLWRRLTQEDEEGGV